MKSYPIPFRVKILAPAAIMLLVLVAATTVTMSVKITRQMQADVTSSLYTARKAFDYMYRNRQRELLQQCRSIPNDPRFKAVAQLGEHKTIRFLLSEVLDEQGLTFLCYHPPEGAPIEVGRHHTGEGDETWFMLAGLEQRALRGEALVSTATIDGRPMDVAMAPVVVGNDVVGGVAVVKEWGESVLREVRDLTGTEVAVLGADGAIESTLVRLGTAGSQAPGKTLLSEATPRDVVPIRIDGERFLALRGTLVGSSVKDPPTFVLLKSLEPHLAELRNAQQLLLVVALAILLAGIGTSWWLAGHVTKPLLQLTRAAEAVGAGDLMGTVEVGSQDEVGELANAFNRMTVNLRDSRDRLETTVLDLQDTRTRLLQSEKLSAIGEFIAGVAHELNNPLTVMVGFSQLLQESNVSDEIRDDIKQIGSSAERCHKVVQNLLSFARQRPPERASVQVNDLLRGTIDFMKYELRTGNIEVELDLCKDLPKVMADEYQLQQVFLNIVNNARQAMEGHAARGKITLRSESLGDRIHVELSDDGPGISRENQRKLFDPFFTTKEPGKGTGLGLSVSYGIIREHEGSIDVHSKVGQGTRFAIELPLLSEEEIAGTSLRQTSVTPPQTRASVQVNVLLVDDEPGILSLTRRMLTRMGHNVDTCLEGEEALQKVQRKNYDLILCDWKMPGMNGRQTYEALSCMRKDLVSHFIFVTGDVLNTQLLQFVRETGSTLIEKPFSADDFRAVLQTVMA